MITILFVFSVSRICSGYLSYDLAGIGREWGFPKIGNRGVFPEIENLAGSGNIVSRKSFLETILAIIDRRYILGQINSSSIQTKQFHGFSEPFL